MTPQDGELLDLLGALCNGNITAEEEQRLARRLREDPAARSLYVQYVDLHLALTDLGLTDLEMGEGEPTAMSPWAATAADSSSPESEVPSPPIIIIDTSAPGPAPVFSALFAPGGWAFSYAAATVITGMLIFGAWVYKVSLEGGPDALAVQVATPEPPSPPGKPESGPPGRITGMADCRWLDPRDAPSVTAPAPLARKYELVSGLLEITYQTGAKVILEGPCSYVVESDRGGFLALGKLTARVERSEVRGQGSGARGQGSDHYPLATSHYPLFAVRTPTAIVTDLGTEFGVEVSKGGTTISHVFRGSVRMNVVAAGAGPQEIVLRQDESARAERAGSAGGPRLARYKAAGISASFKRRLVEPPKVLDLLDIVAGGGGTGNHRECGIDQSSGMQDTWFIPKNDRVGNGQYQPVPWQKLIDGVFIPDGGRGRVVLDSAGDAFAGFPHTCNVAGYPIWARAAKIAWEERARSPFDAIYAMGPGTQYMPEGRGLLGLIPNTGLTFDLAAMRKSWEGARPAHFCAVAGVADAHARFSSLPNGLVEFWLFIDGRLKLHRARLRPEDGPIKVDVAIGPSDRFLTLVSAIAVTEPEQGCDWFVLGDPVLQMASTESENRDGAAVQLPPQGEGSGRRPRKEKP